jgi:hypothetical protein
MDIDIEHDTITLDGVTYDIDRENIENGEKLTVMLDDEPVFPGLEATMTNETYIEEFHNPRSDCDGILGVMLTWHDRYTLGGGKWDEQARGGPDFEVECPVCEGSGELTVFTLDGDLIEDCEALHLENSVGPFMIRLPDCAWCDGEGRIDLHPVEWAKKEHGARVVKPLHFYEHSGITISAGTFGANPGYPFNCPWDSGIVGIVFDTELSRDECGWSDKSDDEIDAELNLEIEVYASYLEGDVRCYDVEDETSGYMDACGGFIGPKGGCEEECFCSLGNAIKKRVNEDNERSYWLAREVVTV